MFAMTRIAQAIQQITPPGQVLFESSGSWVVPAGVTSISMVAVQSGDSGDTTGSTVTYNSTVICRALNRSRIGDGGGDGGAAGSSRGSTIWYGGGGGGAGGYAGNGGKGGSAGSASESPTAGNNGGGGGGGANRGSGGAGALGGGVGVLGQGANGVAGTQALESNGTPGGAGSGGVGRKYGGGAVGTSGSYLANQGGALSYKNNVPVTPGQMVSIAIGGTNGAVRIIWGPGRAFPSTNTGNV